MRLAAFSQTKTNEILPNDIYAERPSAPVGVRISAHERVKMECGSNPFANGTKTQIRCTTTINENKPMFVVDGCIMTDLNVRDINPNNIERIDVLKNEAAVKSYGSAAKNGVIIITTKSGSSQTITSLSATPVLKP